MLSINPSQISGQMLCMPDVCFNYKRLIIDNKIVNAKSNFEVDYNRGMKISKGFTNKA